MPTMQFSLSSFTNKNADLKAGNAFSAYAFGDGVANALILAVRLTLNNIRVYSSQCYLDLAKGSGTGRTANFAQNSAIHNQTVVLSEFAHALIQAGAGDVTFTVRASGGSTGNLINLRDNVSGILEIDYFIPQSDFTLDKVELDAGQTITATIAPTHPDADHEIIWRFQTAHKDYSSVQSDSASYTVPFTKALAVPHSWLDAIPNTESGLATCTVNTYMNGVLTGVVTKQFTIKAGAEILPSIASLSAARINNGVPSGWAEYVQGISGVQLTAHGVNGIYGSSIVEVKTTGAGFTGTSNPCSTGAINAIGDVTFTCTVKDSRGRTKSASVTVTFRAYEPPRFTSIDTIRCNADGTPNDSGTYVKVTVTYTYASVNGKNGISAMETSRRLYTGGSYTQLSTVIAASGAPYVAGNGFGAASSYVVKVTIADGLFAVDTTDIVPTESWLLHYRVGGRGVAIGMIAQRQDAFEVNPLWEIYYKGMTLDERFGGIDIPSIWPVTSGGTGLGEVASGSYLKGNGTGVLIPRTPSQVLSDIGAAASSHSHTKANITDFAHSHPIVEITDLSPSNIGAVRNLGSLGNISSIAALDAYNTYAYEGMFFWSGTTDAFFQNGYLYHVKGEIAYYSGNVSCVQTFTQTYHTNTTKKFYRTYYYASGWSSLLRMYDSNSPTLTANSFDMQSQSIIRGSGKYLQLGPGNATYAHYNTDATNGHWFNSRVYVSGDIYAGANYDKRVYHAGNITNGNAGPSGGVDGDIYLQW